MKNMNIDYVAIATFCIDDEWMGAYPWENALDEQQAAHEWLLTVMSEEDLRNFCTFRKYR